MHVLFYFIFFVFLVLCFKVVVVLLVPGVLCSY